MDFGFENIYEISISNECVVMMVLMLLAVSSALLFAHMEFKMAEDPRAFFDTFQRSTNGEISKESFDKWIKIRMLVIGIFFLICLGASFASYITLCFSL